jgi:hypothetical protein
MSLALGIAVVGGAALALVYAAIVIAGDRLRGAAPPRR